MADLEAPRRVEINDETYELHPGPVRQSLGDEAPMLWGFHFNVYKDGEMLGIKTCFVGRVSVQTSQPEALKGGVQDLAAALYDLAQAKVVEQLEKREFGDDILFC